MPPKGANHTCDREKEDTGLKGPEQVNSLARRNPKKAKEQAAQNNMQGGTPPGKTLIEAVAEWVGNWETRGTVRRARTLKATKNTRETRGILERKGKPCENKVKARKGTNCDVRTTGVWRAEKEKLIMQAE